MLIFCPRGSETRALLSCVDVWMSNDQGYTGDYFRSRRRLALD